MKEITSITTATEAPSSNATLYVEDGGDFKRATVEQLKETLGIDTLSENITAETTRAEAAEEGLTGSIANTSATASANLADEVTRAQGAESTLTANLAAEVTRAQTAEETLTTNLAAEVTRAEGAESTLTANLAAEVTRAQAAEELKANKTDLMSLLFETVSVLSE